MKYFVIYRMKGASGHVYYTPSLANESIDINLFSSTISATAHAVDHVWKKKSVLGYKIHTL